MTPAELSRTAIAELLGVPVGTVDTWKWRGRAGVTFPAPAIAGARPRWRRSDVLSWARAAGVAK